MLFQPDVAVADPATAHEKKLSAILGIRLAIDEVRGKFKYGGNVDEAHRRAVSERLQARGTGGDNVPPPPTWFAAWCRSSARADNQHGPA